MTQSITRFMQRLLAVAVLLCLCAAPALADRRAFVVGVADYVSAVLDVTGHRTANNANGVAAALGQSGWEVNVATDELRVEFRQRLDTFLGAVTTDDTVLFYYAGHGAEIGGLNWLLLRETRLIEGMSTIERDEELRRTSIEVGEITRQISARQVKHLVLIIDACRNDPFATLSAFSLDGGVNPGPGPARSFTLYAADAGNMALVCLSHDISCEGDGEEYTVFTRRLLPLLTQVGLEIADLAKALQTQVVTTADAVGFFQLPVYYPRLDPREGAVYLGPLGPLGVPDTRVAALPGATPQAAIDVAALTRDLQSELRRLGCYTGAVDGNWGPGSRGGAQNFARLVVAEVPAGRPGDAPQQYQALLDTLRGRPAPVCGDAPADPVWLTRDVHAQLTRLGCYTAALDDSWNRGSIRALAEIGRVLTETGSVLTTVPVDTATPAADADAFQALQRALADVAGMPCNARIAEAFFAGTQGHSVDKWRRFLADFGTDPTNPYYRMGAEMLARVEAAGHPRAVQIYPLPDLGWELFPGLGAKGDRVAQYYLGLMYETRLTIEGQDTDVAGWLRRSTEQDFPPGIYLYGQLYYYGAHGIARNIAEAARYYRLAANAGYAEAQSAIGDMYFDGEGVRQDDAEALRYYQLAADQGNANGQVGLAYLYRAGRGVAQNDVASARYMRLAADQGKDIAQLGIAIAFRQGRGVAQNDVEAARYFRLAADQGSATAQYYMGSMYRQGLGGLPDDDVEAVRWFQLAADQGDDSAQASLAAFYEFGSGGLMQSRQMALSYYRLAAKQGNAAAERALARLGG